MVFWKSLEMSKKKSMRPSAYVISMIMQRERMPATGANDTVKSTPSRTDDPSVYVLEYISFWLSMSVVLTLKDILGMSIFVYCGSKELKNDALNVVDIALSRSFTNESYHSDTRGILTTSPIWYSFVGFVGRLISLLLMACMCLIWLNIHIFYWILVLMMSLSLQDMMICTLLHFPVNLLFDMDSKTCLTDVGYFMTMLRIQALVPFLYGNAWLRGLLFSDWDIYFMLWCSQYCVTIPMGVSLGGVVLVPLTTVTQLSIGVLVTTQNTK